MIQEGDLYRNSTGAGTNTTWISRKKGVSNNQSTSYCFGCKNTYSYFWDNVTSCRPPLENNVDSRYRGDWTDEGCMIGGTKRFPGLKRSELDTSEQYRDKYWVGIDCAGFVQRITTAAKQMNIPGVKCNIKDLNDSRLPVITNRHHSSEFGWAGRNDLVYYLSNSNTKKQQKKIRKGDLVYYDGHVAVIYSERPDCQVVRNGCAYELIHAYGGNRRAEEYTYPSYELDSDLSGKTFFARKVIRTWQNINNPLGYSRIKLWD